MQVAFVMGRESTRNVIHSHPSKIVLGLSGNKSTKHCLKDVYYVLDRLDLMVI